MTNAAHIAGSFVRLAKPKQHDPSEALPVDESMRSQGRHRDWLPLFLCCPPSLG